MPKVTTETMRLILSPVHNVVCLRCGKENGMIFPYPLPIGTMFCPTCSPAWLGVYLEWQTRKLQRRIE